MKKIVVIILMISSCVLKEDAPVRMIDLSLFETPLAINPPCTLSNYGEIGDFLPPIKGKFEYIREENFPDYSVKAEIYTGFTGGVVTMIFDKGRPKRNIIYNFNEGKAAPFDLNWYWKIGSGSEYVTPDNGTLYVEVLTDKKVKFTWCDVYFKSATFSSLFSKGSFVLN